MTQTTNSNPGDPLDCGHTEEIRFLHSLCHTGYPLAARLDGDVQTGTITLVCSFCHATVLPGFRYGGNFADVGAFHRKFDLPEATYEQPAPRPLTRAEQTFRLKFMLEELREYCAAVGIKLNSEVVDARTDAEVPNQNLPQAFDALLDLVYVVLGTAHLHRFPWQPGWDEVQRANMTKERCGLDHFYRECPNQGGQGKACGYDPDCPAAGPDQCHEQIVYARDQQVEGSRLCAQPRAAHSLRGSALDVIKPPGWTPPDIAGVLARCL